MGTEVPEGYGHFLPHSGLAKVDREGVGRTQGKSGRGTSMSQGLSSVNSRAGDRGRERRQTYGQRGGGRGRHIRGLESDSGGGGPSTGLDPHDIHGEGVVGLLGQMSGTKGAGQGF